MADKPQGCARVTGTVSGTAPDRPKPKALDTTVKEDVMTARVGKKAPEFTAPAYYQGDFTSVSLSDFAGKWVLLCFYPGDFTFV